NAEEALRYLHERTPYTITYRTAPCHKISDRAHQLVPSPAPESVRRHQDLNAAEAAKVDQYVAAVEAFAASNALILALADELAAGTIDKLMGKSDLELGIEALLRNGRL
ncbi:hypothetical protein AB0F17_64970, partial [Nonomuraea sp. NPDC026600]|uniref:hypothetical protein n=1 Tax=Nonomuraea sp. NPDC026600 TaxID=3155363 RepID=UPI0033CEA168